MPDPLALLVTTLGVWRVTHFVVEEDGPWDVVVRLRIRLGSSAAGRLMDCFYCTSVWVAAPFALVLARDAGSWLLAWLALSGGACLLERATDRSGKDGGAATRPHGDRTTGGTAADALDPEARS